MTTLLLPDEKNKTEKLKEPGRKWRAWFRALEDVTGPTRGTVRAGEAYDSKQWYPSKEIAEQAALEAMREIRAKYGRDTAEFIGAFPSE